MRTDDATDDRSIEVSASTLPVRCLLVALLAVGLLAAPAAAVASAQEVGANEDPPGTNPVCDRDGMDTITGIIEGFVQLTAGLGIMAMIAVWQGDTLAEMFAGSPESKKRLKRHKRTVAKSGITLVVLGPGATVAGKLMGLPITACVNLIPF